MLPNPFLLSARPIVRLTLAQVALALPMAAAFAAAPGASAIAWTAEQQRAAGVQVEVIPNVDVSPAAGAARALPATVVLPPGSQSIVATPGGGLVESVAVVPGQWVAAGTAVATVRSPAVLALRREALQARTQADLASARLARDERLLAEGLIPAARRDDTRAQARVARVEAQARDRELALAGVSRAASGLEDVLVLRAPARALVAEVLASPGQRVEAGAALARLMQPGRLALDVQAPAAQLERLAVGMPLAVEGCAGASGKVTAIAPVVHAGNQTVLVRADLHPSADGCPRVGQMVQVLVTGAAAGAGSGPAMPTVPAAAVVRSQGRSYVFVRQPAGFVPTPVEIGMPQGTRLPVRGGVRPGDAVVVQGTAALKSAWLAQADAPAAAAPVPAASAAAAASTARR